MDFPDVLVLLVVISFFGNIIFERTPAALRLERMKHNESKSSSKKTDKRDTQKEPSTN
jgi:hypothetical protein